MKDTNIPSNLEIMQRNSVKAEAMLKMLANAKRLIILCHLAKGKKSVGELANIAGLSHSALSQHLAKMKKQDLVSDEKQGQMVYYYINRPDVEALLSTLYLIYCKE